MTCKCTCHWTKIICLPRNFHLIRRRYQFMNILKLFLNIIPFMRNWPQNLSHIFLPHCISSSCHFLDTFSIIIKAYTYPPTDDLPELPYNNSLDQPPLNQMYRSHLDRQMGLDWNHHCILLLHKNAPSSLSYDGARPHIILLIKGKLHCNVIDLCELCTLHFFCKMGIF